MAIGQYNSSYTGRQIDEAITKALNWIQKDEIKTDMLADSSVTTNKLADSSVTTNKILDEAIGLNKLSKDLQGKIGEDFVNSVIFEYGLKDSIDITDDENVIDTIYGNAENDFGIHVLYHYDDIYDGGNTPIDYSFLIVGAEKKDGVAVVSQTLIKSNGQILYRDMSHPDSVAHEWSEWKSIYFTEEDAEVLKNEIEAKINAKPGKIRSDGAAVFENTIENGDVVIAVKGDTIAPFARDLSGNMGGGWELDGICIGVAPEDVETFESLEYIYVTYNGEPLKLKVGNFTNSGLAGDFWGDTCIGANLYAYFYNNEDFDFTEQGLVQENLEPIGYYFENAFRVKKSGEVKSPTIDDLYQRTDAGVIVCAAEGEYSYVNDSTELPIEGLRVCGKTKQLKSTGRNLIPFPYNDCKKGTGVVEINGITFTINEDGTILVNGTATAEAAFFLYRDYGNPSSLPLPVGTYSINSFCTASGMIFQAAIGYNNLTKYLYKQSKSNISITSDMPDATTTSIRILVYSGRTINNALVYPMFEKGSVFHNYEPPTNGMLSPSPDRPQPMNSAGKDGRIGIDISNEDGSESQALSVSTPNGLPGVPVSSGGNYTDEKGQQWVCDEIDFAKGLYIQRVEMTTVPGYSDIDIVNRDGKSYMYWVAVDISRYVPGGGLCSVAVYDDYDEGYKDNTFNLFFNGDGLVSMELLGEYPDDFRDDEAKKEDFANSVLNQPIILILKEPIVKEIPYDLMMRYRELTTYEPTTHISNDGGAHIEVKYIADTKTYIDNKFAELQATILNNI